MRNRLGRTWNQRWLCSGNLVDNTCNTGGRTTVTIRFRTSMIVQGLFPKCTSDCCHTWQGTPRCKSTVRLEHLRWMWDTHVGAKARSDDLKQAPVDMHMQNMHAADPNGLLLKASDWLMLAVHCTAIRKLPTYQSALSIWKHLETPTRANWLQLPVLEKIQLHLQPKRPKGSGPLGCRKPLPNSTTKLPPAVLPNDGCTHETCTAQDAQTRQSWVVSVKIYEES